MCSRPSSRPSSRNSFSFENVSESEYSSAAVNRKLEIMLRKEKKAMLEEQEFTHKPKLIANNRRPTKRPAEGEGSPAANDQNRFDKLYSDAMKRHLEVKAGFDEKDLTFKPKISPKGSRSRPSSRERGGIGERLHSVRTGNISAEVQALNTHSFRPEISPRARSTDRRESQKASVRLYEQNQQIKAKKEKLEADLIEKEKLNCTFSPKTNSNPKNSFQSKLSVTERMERYEKMKNLKIEQARELKAAQEEAKLSFQPKVGNGSRRYGTPNSAKRGSTPTRSEVFSRLASPSPRNLRSSYNEQDSMLTFKPKLISKRSMSPKTRSSEFANVHERLFHEGLARKKEAEFERELLKQEQEANMTFCPAINSRSRAVAESEDSAPVFERLSNGGSRQYMQEVLAKIKEELDLKDCTFRPMLLTDFKPPKQKYGGFDDLPVYERLNHEAERLKTDHQRRQSEKEKHELDGITFTPVIPASSATIVRKKSVAMIDGHNPMSEQDDVYRRLNSTPIHHNVDHSLLESSDEKSLKKTRSKSIIMKEKDIDQVVDRLYASGPKRDLSPPPEAKAVKLKEKDAEEAFDRLYSKSTKSRRASVTASQAAHAEAQAAHEAENRTISPTPSSSSLSRDHSVTRDHFPNRNSKFLPPTTLDQVFQRISKNEGETSAVPLMDNPMALSAKKEKPAQTRIAATKSNKVASDNISEGSGSATSLRARSPGDKAVPKAVPRKPKKSQMGENGEPPVIQRVSKKVAEEVIAEVEGPTSMETPAATETPAAVQKEPPAVVEELDTEKFNPPPVDPVKPTEMSIVVESELPALPVPPVRSDSANSSHSEGSTASRGVRSNTLKGKGIKSVKKSPAKPKRTPSPPADDFLSKLEASLSMLEQDPPYCAPTPADALVHREAEEEAVFAEIEAAQ